MKKMTLEVREYGEKVYYVCDRAVSVRCDACGHSHTVFHVVVKMGRVLRTIWDDLMGLRYDIGGGGGGGGDRVDAKDVFTTKHEAVGARHEKLAEKLAADATTKTTKRKAEKAGEELK